MNLRSNLNKTSVLELQISNRKSSNQLMTLNKVCRNLNMKWKNPDNNWQLLRMNEKRKLKMKGNRQPMKSKNSNRKKLKLLGET